VNIFNASSSTHIPMLYLADIRVTGITTIAHMTNSAVFHAQEPSKSPHDAQRGS
jgi:hypothetical protein